MLEALGRRLVLLVLGSRCHLPSLGRGSFLCHLGFCFCQPISD